MNNLICLHCSKPFQSRRSTSKYCSHACAGHGHARGRIPFTDRFWMQVGRKQTNGCILWAGTMNSDGYGVISNNGENVRAHRLSYELCVGPIPDGLHVLHHCDNRPCINPVHLFAGSDLDNMLDMARKGRSMKGRKHSKTWSRRSASSFPNPSEAS